jgi:RNA polymerase sigma factor (sigma-70 family)
MKARLSEKNLIAVVQTRTRIGAETLYDNYAATLFKVIYCYVKDQQLAEDILEQTFIKIWNSIDQYQSQPGGIYAWMISIARNLSKNVVKRIDNPIHLNRESQKTVEDVNYPIHH